MGIPRETIDAAEALRVEQPEWTEADQAQMQRDLPPPFPSIEVGTVAITVERAIELASELPADEALVLLEAAEEAVAVKMRADIAQDRQDRERRRQHYQRKVAAREWGPRRIRPSSGETYRLREVRRPQTRREAHGLPRQTRAGPDEEGDSSSGEGDPDPVEALLADLADLTIRIERRLRHVEGQLADLWDFAEARLP